MMSSTLTSASAYKPDDPAVKYHCFATDADGKYNLTAEGDLIPCPIDHGDNAWMLTSSALVLMMTPGRLGDLLRRLIETEERSKHPSHGVYNHRNYCHPICIIRI